jgi:serine/tyrosine/threonine adenylyltransferase
MKNQLNALQFDNQFLYELSADTNSHNIPRQVFNAVYSRVKPTSVINPQLVSAAKEVAELLDLSDSVFQSPDFTQVFSGNQLLDGMDAHAVCYGGHQFGNWAGQLGDGRVINLGEVLNQRGEHWTLQLKGAGPTPYSRTADGLAVLRSSVREFLCSEAMFHLGVPTTRALSLITTGEKVKRDMFYDGNPEWELGAIVCRVAPSFIRFGNFEIFSARGDITLLKQLADFTIRHYFSVFIETNKNKEKYIEWFKHVCTSTAEMIAHWMRVGFVHGVMNTDNMSILGLTIDYGPYGWLENYDPNWTPNTTDAQMRRYAFGSQPYIALWNLTQLANAIYPLINEVEPLQQALDLYRQEYTKRSARMTANKYGFVKDDLAEDKTLIEKSHQLMHQSEIDMTIFYRLLANIDLDFAMPELALSLSDKELVDKIHFSYYAQPNPEQHAAMATWLREYLQRIQKDVIGHGETNAKRRERMNKTNPKYVLRNYLAQQAINLAEQGDYSEVNKLLEIMRKPYDEQPEDHTYFAKRPEWAKHKAGCSMLSCSS